VEHEATAHKAKRGHAALVVSTLCALAVLAGFAASARALNHPTRAGASAALPHLAVGPLVTGVFEPTAFAVTDLALRRTVASGATTVRVMLYWSTVAPRVREAGFRPENPGDPAYAWEPVDRQIRSVAAHGIAPILSIQSAPSWAAQSGPGPPGTVRPDPAELAHFATAAARRYSGAFAGLPRVRYWQAWNEPNLTAFLAPQFVGKRSVSPAWYRAMVNAFSGAVHSVHRDNIVVAGGLAPFTVATSDNPRWGMGPLAFMREMLCLSKKLNRTCRAQTRFDAWSHHPYTTGGPTHHARLPNDVSIPDLPEMSRLLNAAVSQRRVISRQRVRFWVTEFSWDTSPPDPQGVPSQLHGRWVAEALYRMWSAGVSLVTWFMLRDSPMNASPFQAGLYFAGSMLEQDRPKPALRAFRFPFVALPEKGRVVAWGRTPTSRRGRVVLERRLRGGWRRLAVVRANRHGIFQRTFKMRPGGYVRAHVATGELSLPFAVKKTPDRAVCPFGTIPNCVG
jgi:hypothetical protein